MAKGTIAGNMPLDQPVRRGTDEPLVEGTSPGNARWTDEAEDASHAGQVAKGALGEDEGPSPRAPQQPLTHSDLPFQNLVSEKKG